MPLAGFDTTDLEKWDGSFAECVMDFELSVLAETSVEIKMSFNLAGFTQNSIKKTASAKLTVDSIRLLKVIDFIFNFD